MRVVIASLVLALGGCIIPFGLPPLRGEVGGTTAVGGGGRALHAGGGVNLAGAMLRRDQRFDVGAGMFVDVTEAEVNDKGAYLDFAAFVDRSRRTRTAIASRGELRWAGGDLGAGAKLRVERELFASGVRKFTTNGRCGTSSGVHAGTTGVAIYVEGGRVWHPQAPGAWTATAGLAVRLPASVGVFVGIPWCK